MRRHRHLFDDRAQFCKAPRGIADMRIDVGFRIGMAEAFLDHGDAHSLDAAHERLGVARPAATPRWRVSRPSGPAMTSNSSALSRTFAVIGPQVSIVISSSPMPV
jgi:hypothetical protein